jgi:predicted aspartyl protease
MKLGVIFSLKRKQRRKPLLSRTLIQAIVFAVAFHVVVILFIFYNPGHLRGAKETFHAEPAAHETNNSGLPEQLGKRSIDKGGFVQALKSRTMGSREANEQTVYCWTDQNGVRNFSNLPPPTHVKDFETRKMPSAYHDSSETKVLIKENHVLVPVTLIYKGKEALTYLLLDTGATTTVVNRKVADLLKMNCSRHSYTRVADGRKVRVELADLDYIEVGPNRMPNFTTSIIDYQGNPEPYDGLLGMNFLKEVNYHVDFKRGVISWARFE